MCGINGIIRWGMPKGKLQNTVQSMNRALAHRGPDGEGIWQHDTLPLVLGHRRLSILDLSAAGNQPMIDPMSGAVISFNGEIYNYRELNTQHLPQANFRSSSDTETILHLYRKMGSKAFALLNGMFALALWDEVRQELLLVRDRLGKKPLYVYQNSDQLVFSSEIKALFEVEGLEKNLDEAALYDWLTFNMALTPKTLFRNIRKLEPGTMLRVSSDGRISQERFAEVLPDRVLPGDEKELAEHVLQTLHSSVNWRMRSDVPVGLFLSGGVDSSAILALMSQQTDRPVNAFSIAFEGQDSYNETQYATRMAQQFGATHHVKTVKPDDLLAFMPQITQIYDEPQADTTAIPIYFLSQAAHEAGIKVILNGDGADELFAGYRAYLNYARWYPRYQQLLRLPVAVRRLMLSPFKNSASQIRREMAERAVAGREFFWSGASGIRESQKGEYLDPDFMQRVNGDSYHYIRELKADFDAHFTPDYINWMCYSGLRQAVTERFLFRADRLGMAHGIEARSPFLDDRMVQLALGIPGALKIKNGEPKYLLKKALEGVLPHEILYRKKMGFCLPLREWAGSTIVHEVESQYRQFCSETGIFRPETIARSIADFKAGKDQEANQIWTFYFFMQWHKNWF